LTGGTLESRDSGDSSMCSSSELSISRSMPVIFPASAGCKAWIRGYNLSPEWDANNVVILNTI